MIVCPRCSKENQDHYKFCLGCGAELPREAAKKDFAPPTPTDPPAAAEKNLEFAATQQGDSLARESHPVPQPELSREPTPVPEKPAAGPNNCPACSNPVPVDFKFCGTCGHRMDEDAPAEAPAPAPEPAPAAEPAAPAVQARATLVLINPDGTEGASFSLPDGSSQVGRDAGGLFAGDAYMSPVHATFAFSADGCIVRDEDSLNGVYVKIGRDQPVRLNDGDVFRIGQEIVRFTAIAKTGAVDGVEQMGSPNPDYIGRLSLVVGRTSTGNSYTIPSDGMHIGRERGDVIFPEDGYVSGLHCRIHHDGKGVVLTDVGSSNGTFMRVKGEQKVQNGELLLMGQQLFRLQF
ncbi:MAG: FHA domain-containing protein [Myxococcales bacterium]|nr:FHA domain-containing protein [Myxococcales bacterium]